MSSKLSEQSRQELASLAARPDASLDLSDIPETQASDWHGATRGKFYRPTGYQIQKGVFGGHLTGNQWAAFQMRPFHVSNAHGVVNLPTIQTRPR